MFRQKKKELDGNTYKRSLICKDSTVRFYDQLAAHNKQYERTRFQIFLEKWSVAKRERARERLLRKLEKRQLRTGIINRE